MRVSFTAQWAAHSPRGKVTFSQAIQGDGRRFLSYCWHLRPPPPERDKRLEAELTHNYHSKPSGLCAEPCPDRHSPAPRGCQVCVRHPRWARPAPPPAAAPTGVWARGTRGTDVGWSPRWVRLQRVTHRMGWRQSHSGTLPADRGLRETACSILWEREGDQGGNYYFIN